MTLEKQTLRISKRTSGGGRRTGKPCALINPTGQGFSWSSRLRLPNWSSSPQLLSHSSSSVPLLERPAVDTDCFVYSPQNPTAASLCTAVRCRRTLSGKSLRVGAARAPRRHEPLRAAEAARCLRARVPCPQNSEAAPRLPGSLEVFPAPLPATGLSSGERSGSESQKDLWKSFLWNGAPLLRLLFARRPCPRLRSRRAGGRTSKRGAESCEPPPPRPARRPGCLASFSAAEKKPR